MRCSYREDWRFTITVSSVGHDNDPRRCRLGFEPDDTFTCNYATPAEFCPKMMTKLYSYLEAVRSGGDLRALGGDASDQISLICPDGVVTFRVKAERS